METAKSHRGLETEDHAARPRSAVSQGVNLVGFACLGTAVVLSLLLDLSIPVAASLFLFAYAAPIMALELIVCRTHRRASTGLDWTRGRHYSKPNLQRLAIKLAGCAATLAVVAGAHALLGLYAPEAMQQAGEFFLVWGLLLWPLVLVYFFVIDQAMTSPEDGYSHMGRLVLGRWDSVDFDELWHHAKSWAVRGFFLPIMTVYLFSAIGRLKGLYGGGGSFDIFLFIAWVSTLATVLELPIVCVGYICTMRLFDSHIRSTNPYLLGWVVTLSVYEPFNIIVTGRILKYRDGQDWTFWFADSWLAVPWGVVLFASFAIHLWSKFAFGLRWSNLTHRGIITDGPYRWTRHPDYLSKVVFFWLVAVPFLSVSGPLEALKGTVAMVGVSLIYYARAVTEERHLSEDPDYRAYALAMNRAGIFAPLGRAMPFLQYPFIMGAAVKRTAAALVVLFALAALILLTIESAKDPNERIVSAVREFGAAHGLPGGVVVVGHTNAASPRIVTFGVADPTTAEPISPQARFHLASLSKPLTAASILSLAAEGVLHLDDCVGKWLPYAAAAGTNAPCTTLRQVIEHTAGYDRFTIFDPMLFPERLGLRNDADCEAVARAALRAAPLSHPPKPKQTYSNLGYCLLQLVIEAATGRPFPDVVAERTRVAPLTFADPTPRHWIRTSDGWQRALVGTKALALQRFGAAGGLQSTAPAYWAFAARPHPATRSERPSGAEGPDFYALGWHVWTGPQGVQLTHWGRVPGVFGFAAQFSTGTTVVALFNGGVDNGSAAFDALFDRLCSLQRLACR